MTLPSKTRPLKEGGRVHVQDLPHTYEYSGSTPMKDVIPLDLIIKQEYAFSWYEPFRTFAIDRGDAERR